MRPISRAHLARQLAASIREAQCEGLSRSWSDWEAAHAAAITSDQAAAAAAPAVALCAGCAEVDRCAERARLDLYTGLAAGSAWVNGVRKSTAALVLSPEPPQRRAG